MQVAGRRSGAALPVGVKQGEGISKGCCQHILQALTQGVPAGSRTSIDEVPYALLP